VWTGCFVLLIFLALALNWNWNKFILPKPHRYHAHKTGFQFFLITMKAAIAQIKLIIRY